MSDRKLLYVAGPYTHDDPVWNTHSAIRTATAIYEQTGWVPFVPHLTLAWHLVTPRPVDFWYDLDRHYLRRCEAFLRLPGPSSGAELEEKLADELRLEFVYFGDLPPAVRRHWPAP
jgi:hypothetical protein